MNTKEVLQQFKSGLLDSVLPFWLKYAIDTEDGGYLFCLDRDGTVLDGTKPMWIHGRFIWLLSTLCYHLPTISEEESKDPLSFGATEEVKKKWLELAKHGVDFIRKHAFDSKTGRMYYSLTKEGSPLRMRRYMFAESFAVISLAAYARVSGDKEALKHALKLFKLLLRNYTNNNLIIEPISHNNSSEDNNVNENNVNEEEEKNNNEEEERNLNFEENEEEERRNFEEIIRPTLPPKFEPNTIRGQSKGLGLPMILISTAQILRETIEDLNTPYHSSIISLCNYSINLCIEEIKRDFMKEEFKAVMELVGPNGEFIDSFDGRLLTPGHAIEASWFILHEAKYRNEKYHLADIQSSNDIRSISYFTYKELLHIGLTILDWEWEIGWDKEFGGLLYYVDCKGFPSPEYWHDMKFWWPHNEATIATLLAYSLSNDKKYFEWFKLVNEWSHSHFPDEKCGEWFGYLHRDGSLSSRIKGNLFKGPFHIPRMQLYCWELLHNNPKLLSDD